MNEQSNITIAIVFGIIGFISLIIIIYFTIWFILRRRSSLRKSSISQRQQYRRPRNLASIKLNTNQRKKRRRRFNTNESAISLSFSPPHLINQNVKNLDILLPNEPSLQYHDTLPTTINNYNRCYTNPKIDPIYTSSSSVSPSPSNFPVAFQSYQQLNTFNFDFLNELNQILYLKQEPRSMNPVRYSQSCRQSNDLLPFDYYRSLTPSTMTITTSSNETLFEPFHNQTTRYSNAPLMRKAQFRDDTAILY